MARRNLVGIARPDAECRAVIRAHAEPAGNSVADVAMLAGFRAGDRGYVLSPLPSGLEDEATDRDLVEHDDLDDTVRKPSNLVGAAESLSLKSWHDHDVSRRVCGFQALPDRMPRPGSRLSARW